MGRVRCERGRVRLKKRVGRVTCERECAESKGSVMCERERNSQEKR